MSLALLAPSAPAPPGIYSMSLATAAVLLCFARAAAGVSLPNLELTVRQPTPVPAGQNVSVTAEVLNRGVATQSTTLTLLLSEGVAFLTGPAGWSCSADDCNTVVTCDIGSVGGTGWKGTFALGTSRNGLFPLAAAIVADQPDADSTDDHRVLVLTVAAPNGLPAPTITAPASGQVIGVPGVGLEWASVVGAAGYDVRITSAGRTVFSGTLLGRDATSTTVSLPNGDYSLAVRACNAAGFSDTNCGSYATRSFRVQLIAPTAAPTVTSPTPGATLTASTQTFSWTAVAKAYPGLSLSYEVLLVDVAAGNVPELQISVPDPNLSTIFTLHSSTQYQLRVRACQAGCGPWSAPVTFAVALPAVPSNAPTIGSCNVTGGNSLTCSWSAVSGADVYSFYVIQPATGPGGGALTVAARLVSKTTVTLPVPRGFANVIVAACTGDGCGPFSRARGIDPPGPNPSQPNLGTPLGGSVVAGPTVVFSWNRIPGDDGTNTWYRLYVQDLSRQAAALDVYTRQNYYAAYFKAEGARYDAIAIANPGLPGQVVGPAQGFNVSGRSPTAPTMVAPAHNSTVTAGNVQLGWSPVPGATLYEYYVGVLGSTTPTARGVTPGLVVYAPLVGASGGILYSGIVRACPQGATCVAGSDAGWGPWSNEPGGPGVSNFTVTP